MSTTISEHQARVYEYAKARRDQWFTAMELSTETNVPANSAKSHAARFEEIGIFERIRISPAHAFRLDADAIKHAPKMIARLEEAMRIFASRRVDWLRREEEVVRRLDLGGLPVEAAVSERPSPAPSKDASASHDPSPPSSKELATSTGSDAARPAVDRRSKVDLLFSLIARPQGASLEELAAALGNQPHSVRATISVKSRERGVAVRCTDGRYFMG